MGTGSGYQSALLSELSNHVYTIEIVEPCARETDAIYRKHEAHYPEYRNVHRKIDDGYFGWSEYAPFDRIIVTCGIDHVPPELLRQLAPERDHGHSRGAALGPDESPHHEARVRRRLGDVLEREDIFQGKKRKIFVPFTAKDGVRTLLDESGTGN